MASLGHNKLQHVKLCIPTMVHRTPPEWLVSLWQLHRSCLLRAPGHGSPPLCPLLPPPHHQQPQRCPHLQWGKIKRYIKIISNWELSQDLQYMYMTWVPMFNTSFAGNKECRVGTLNLQETKSIISYLFFSDFWPVRRSETSNFWSGPATFYTFLYKLMLEFLKILIRTSNFFSLAWTLFLTHSSHAQFDDL